MSTLRTLYEEVFANKMYYNYYYYCYYYFSYYYYCYHEHIDSSENIIYISYDRENISHCMIY